MYATGESHWGDPYGGGFLGMGHNPFKLMGGRSNMASSNMTLNGVTLDRLNDRDRACMSILRVNINRQIDRTGASRVWTHSPSKPSEF